jgi:hypothetical protein
MLSIQNLGEGHKNGLTSICVRAISREYEAFQRSQRLLRIFAAAILCGAFAMPFMAIYEGHVDTLALVQAFFINPLIILCCNSQDQLRVDTLHNNIYGIRLPNATSILHSCFSRSWLVHNHVLRESYVMAPFYQSYRTGHHHNTYILCFSHDGCRVSSDNKRQAEASTYG